MQKFIRVRLNGYHIPPRCRKASHVSLTLGRIEMPAGLPTHPADFKVFDGAQKATVLAQLESFKRDAQKALQGMKAPEKFRIMLTEVETEEGSPFVTETVFPFYAEEVAP